ncbi:hypothetical protein GGX14DRAFT_557121 [Mycena pura]|uniref:Uncharacterized protein n=1 Tax=Mycena pura TaxID=153505 RepID=A0AAD6YMV7_9AGAR|nr:hypothetical protein GGX14DRAFT_557121 [Mycena pura]
MTGLLDFAIRFGIPFQLCIKLSEVHAFRTEKLSLIAREINGAPYTPGFEDATLEYKSGGASLYKNYLANVAALLDRPEAVAFIAKGGILRFLAEKYCPGLIKRFKAGPSLQVTEFQRGEQMILTLNNSDDYYTVDEVTDGQINILLGHVRTGHANTELYLWPRPELLEQFCDHMKGYMSNSMHQYLERMWKSVHVEKNYEWRTNSKWKAYLRRGNKGRFAPKVIPSTEDFEKGKCLFARAFPIKWDCIALRDVVLPEVFDPISHRD